MRGPSVGRRLSLWLALQGLLGSLLVCAAVYVDARDNLANRQAESLENKQVQILHLLREAGSDPGFGPLRHKLDDYFVGHDETALELRDRAGAIVYASVAGPAGTVGERSLNFDAPALPWSDGPLTATLRIDVRADDLLLRRLMLSLVLAAAGASVVASVTGYLLVRAGLKPIGELTRQARSLGAASLHRRLAMHGQPAELRPLVDQFNDLLSRLDLAYTQLESFNADVAHELCTPLATLIGSSELALRRARDSTELRDVIGFNLEELQRLAEIVHDMLFLSRADRGARARTEHVPSVAGLVRAVGEYHEAALEAAGLALAVQGDAAASLDLALTRRALSNLLDNATRYADRGSTVEVLVASDEDGSGIRLSVRNQGPAIDATVLPRIFDRFYRGDKARPDASAHHGLGLAIVAAIARMHGGSAFANSTPGATEVGMRLPVRPPQAGSAPAS